MRWLITGHVTRNEKLITLYVGPGGAAVALVLIGTVTFIGFYHRTQDMRSALAASAWLTYLALLGSFLNLDVRHRLGGGVGKTLVITLTSFVGAISGFYFLAQTSENRARIKHQK